MNNARTSIFAYGIYAIGAGLAFLFMPNFTLGLFGFEPTTEHWIRVVAILTLGLAYYYISSAMADNKHFYQISWIGRLWFVVATAALAFMGLAPLNILLVGSVDLLTAIWTAMALRNS